MNHLTTLNTLNNQYFALRHGESVANQKDLIVSSPENGIKDYGLSETGQKQIRDSIEAFNTLNNKTRIISSDFLRTAESAQIARQLLQAEREIQFSPLLRERFFGDHELKDNSFYQNVWDMDLQDSAHNNNNVESTDAVLERTTSFIATLETNFKDEVFLLVSHGDALQILQTAFSKVPASTHRSLTHLQTAEIRELVLQN
ncbi:histidine phosphatase family protein [Cocleimonas sp. KMM 6892]|uniref:histidine phosphatase family protein n=1 Tax=unclassified Cocleimonas TaxID=2639732 RepID=UPI002DB935A1|nr:MULTISPECIES: histidine phosphatase family protein [unclassified Cocleimonas]MEB8434065.1 histidine phosphatase family protein [Cocleimonas sp. KMM 6892]MEC4717075.1 histidine phosphatase family protein [Cocleimonas sp. KMM 6895]MEC4746337.1 histidine phosphatase family protein [Cocleimonas sp. KMM 6896]